MHYYPILSTPYAVGKTTVFNFPTRNIPRRYQNPVIIYLVWSNGFEWFFKRLDSVTYGCHFSLDYITAASIINDDFQPFLHISPCELPPTSTSLPSSSPNFIQADVTWRATISLKSLFSDNTASYQGEIPIFRSGSSCLSFSSLTQNSPDVHNDLFFVNLQSLPFFDKHNLIIFDLLNPTVPLDTIVVYNNTCNFIKLDQYMVDPELLFGISCTSMSGVPLFISHQDSTSRLTMEHTHPPASLFIHGNRFYAQKQVKESWELFTSNFK